MEQEKDPINELTKAAEGRIKYLEQKVEALTNPARESLLKRFPTLFTLLVTFGVVTTFLAFEQILFSIPILYENPVFMLAIGVGILVLTGTLYKKLG